MSHIFISYSRKDKLVVGEYVKKLRTENFVIWQDVNDISGGDMWEKEIRRAIAECTVFIIFWSQNAKDSEWVNREVDIALELRKRIIPFMLDPQVELRKDLAEYHFVTTPKELVQSLNGIAPRITWDRLNNLDIKRPISEQNAMPIEISGETYLSVTLVKSLYSEATLITKPDTIIKNVSRIQMVIQCTGAKHSIVEDVLKNISDEDSLYPNRKQPIVCLHITGPIGKDKNGIDSYILDNNILEHFTNINGTAQHAINLIAGSTGNPKTFQMFQKSLVEIAFLMAREFPRWHSFQLYKWTGTHYAHMIDLDADVPGHHGR